MPKRILALLVGTTALLAVHVGATAARAETITIRPGGSFTATAARTLTFDPGRLSIACDITFVGSITSTSIVAPPSTHVNIGSISRASASSCSGGASLTFLGTPWTLLHDFRFQILIPVALVIFRNVQFMLTIGAFRCLYSGDIKFKVDAIDLWRPNPGILVPIFSNGILCARAINISGDLSVSPSQTFTVR